MAPLNDNSSSVSCTDITSQTATGILAANVLGL
jgi:hypothetical protein